MQLKIPIPKGHRAQVLQVAKNLRQKCEGNVIGFVVLTILLLWVGIVLWTPALWFSGYFFSRMIVWCQRMRGALNMERQLAEGELEL